MSPDGPLSRGQIDEVFLAEVEFRRNLEFDFDLGSPTYSIPTKIEAELLDNRTQGLVRLHAEIKWHSLEGQPEEPFELSLVVGGLFQWLAPELDDEEIIGWLEFNGEHLLWPYLRSHISSITAASGLPPLTIYTIMVPHPTLGRWEEDPASESSSIEKASD